MRRAFCKAGSQSPNYEELRITANKLLTTRRVKPMHKPSRFAKVIGLFAAAAVIASCAPAAPAEPPAPAPPAEAPAAPAEATAAPAAPPAEAKPAEQPAPAAPTTYKQAPMLEELEKAGKIPPLAERLPKVPFVVGPGVLVAEKDLPDWQPGKYGGTLRSAHAVANWSPDFFVMANEPLLISPGIGTDAIRGNVIQPADLPRQCVKVLGETHGQRIDAMVRGVIMESLQNEDAGLCISEEIKEQVVELRDFLWDRVYENPLVHEDFEKCAMILEALYTYFLKRPEAFLQETGRKDFYDEPATCICDNLAGMTDRYAFNLYEKLFLPLPWKIAI